MDLRQLRTFSCVAELGSLSKASDTLRVAQPALSRQIKLLEHELRTELFIRNGRGMTVQERRPDQRLILRHRCFEPLPRRRRPVSGRLRPPASARCGS